MSRLLALSLWLVSASVSAQTELHFESPGLPPPPMLTPQLVAREQALHGCLHALAERDRPRPWMAALVITAGAALVTVGAVYPYEAGPFFLPFGVHGLARGVLLLSTTDDARPHRDRYAALPMIDDSQLGVRISRGEQSLERLAHQYRRLRITDGVLSLLLAASYVPLRYGMARLQQPHYRYGDDFADYLVLGLAALEVSNGVLRFFEQSAAEQARDDYRKLRWGVAPAPHGAVFGTNMRF
jgi:hypothetical protein